MSRTFWPSEVRRHDRYPNYSRPSRHHPRDDSQFANSAAIGDDDIEVVGSDGPTDQTRPDYLQRCPVGMWLYPWIDVGSYQPNGKPWPLIARVERLRQIELI